MRFPTGRRFRWHLAAAAAASLAVLGGTTPAHALTFNLTFDDASFTAAGYNVASVHNAVNFVAGEFSSLFNDPIHVNIHILAGNTGLGGSSTALVGFLNYAATRTALISDNTLHPSTDGTTSVNNLPGVNPTINDQYAFSHAQAKALGLIGDTVVADDDGTYTFSNAQNYTFATTQAGRQAAGAFDFVGVTEHEFSEIMGRIPGLGTTAFNGNPSFLVDDLFRFTASGVPSFTTSATGVYFSINNGATNLVGFNSTPGNDLQDYAGAVPTDPYNASTGPNQAHLLSGVDITNMDVIGYDLITQGTAAPEPSSLAILGLGLIGAGFGIRRRKGA